mmetsp:Transcript_6678/g.27926  ORF Transcript_6678/g.27926 Transcript_6678/m.27926 type:complete len:211 (-) Transcript_6678:866-1498(-)
MPPLSSITGCSPRHCGARAARRYRPRACGWPTGRLTTWPACSRSWHRARWPASSGWTPTASRAPWRSTMPAAAMPAGCGCASSGPARSAWNSPRRCGPRWGPCCRCCAAGWTWMPTRTRSAPRWGRAACRGKGCRAAWTASSSACGPCWANRSRWQRHARWRAALSNALANLWLRRPRAVAGCSRRPNASPRRAVTTSPRSASSAGAPTA